MNDTFLDLYMSSGCAVHLHLDSLFDLTTAVQDGDTLVPLVLVHGQSVTVVVDKIEGWSISTPESRAAYDQHVNSLHENEEDDSSEPWKS